MLIDQRFVEKEIFGMGVEDDCNSNCFIRASKNILKSSGSRSKSSTLILLNTSGSRSKSSKLIRSKSSKLIFRLKPL